MPVKANGMAHIQLTVSNENWELSRKFYRSMCTFLGMTAQYDNKYMVYYIGGRTGIAIAKADSALGPHRFNQRSVGLHHFCIRLRSQEDVHSVFNHVSSLQGCKVVRAPAEDSYAPGYFSFLVEDPDGIRIEMNFIPGKGNLDPSVDLPKAKM
eukprot:TRINITY_DN68034_c9_g5_i1.p1 TRINITY_DN68034_c9_g5~~TRINITY_DN68034_c9_g5_i1.p1  ORF type:complete len:153 (+),score=10.79 TRINITY_DN68034_c9_g5_i1:47-505(+)